MVITRDIVCPCYQSSGNGSYYFIFLKRCSIAGIMVSLTILKTLSLFPEATGGEIFVKISLKSIHISSGEVGHLNLLLFLMPT